MCVCVGGGGGQGLFALYIIENFILSLDRHLWTDFNIIYQKCSFGDPLPRFFKPSLFVNIYSCLGEELGLGVGGGERR